MSVESSFDDGTLLITPTGVLYFGSAPQLSEALLELLAEKPEADRILFDLGNLGRIDYTGALTLKSVAEEAERAGLEVDFLNLPPQTRRILGKVLEQPLPDIDGP